LNLKRRTVLEARRVWKVYGTKVQVKALQGIDLPISEGEFVAIQGPSGSGKSTLMHILGCLERPTQGEVVIEGVNIAELSQSELAEIRGKKIGFVFQQFNLLPRTTAQKNVELPLVFLGIGRRERHKRAAELLDEVGLGGRLNHTSSQLSGGEQQRVAIARALVSNPTIIFADEPTGNLDTDSSTEIMAIMRKLNDEGKTLVVVTHDSDIANWADRIVHLQDGRIVENET
jgi:putative ABC transport system ATP-binding protein